MPLRGSRKLRFSSQIRGRSVGPARLLPVRFWCPGRGGGRAGSRSRGVQVTASVMSRAMTSRVLLVLLAPGTLKGAGWVSVIWSVGQVNQLAPTVCRLRPPHPAMRTTNSDQASDGSSTSKRIDGRGDRLHGSGLPVALW